MMRGTSDMQMLTEVLKETLPEREAEAFREMLERLEAGRFPELTVGQREWVTRTHRRVCTTYENLASSGKVKLERKIGLQPYEVMPRPLRPPGR